MKKMGITKELVQAWVRNSSNEQERKIRFIHHDEYENKINRSWNKDYIQNLYTKYINGEAYIETIIFKLINI